MSAKLAFHLIQMGKGTFSFQVTEQSDRVTSYVKTRQGRTFTATNGWRVMVHKHPEVDVANKIVYLRGEQDHKDLKVHSTYNLDSKECEKTIKAVKEALRQTVEAAKNWKQNREVSFIDHIIINPGMVWDPWASLRHIPGITIVSSKYGCK